jgi:hypothetical protein
MRPFEVVLLTIKPDREDGGGASQTGQRQPIDPKAFATLPCQFERSNTGLAEKPPVAPGEKGTFAATNTFLATVTIPSDTKGVTIALPLDKTQYKQTRAAVRMEGQITWLASTPRQSCPEIWGKCEWTTFHGALNPAWRGKTLELLLLSAEKRPEDKIEANLFILDSQAPAP